jgi:hypothetical protein
MADSRTTWISRCSSRTRLLLLTGYVGSAGPGRSEVTTRSQTGRHQLLLMPRQPSQYTFCSSELSNRAHLTGTGLVKRARSIAWRNARAASCSLRLVNKASPLMTSPPAPSRSKVAKTVSKSLAARAFRTCNSRPRVRAVARISLDRVSASRGLAGLHRVVASEKNQGSGRTCRFCAER